MPIVRVRTAWTGLVQGGGLSTHYFTQVVGTDAEDLQAVVQTFWGTCAPQITNECSFRVLGEMDVIDETTGELIETMSTIDGATTAGTSTEDNQPPATQTLLRLRTGAVVAGRRLQGRLFIPGPPRNGTGDTLTPTTASRAAYQNAAAALITATTGIGPWVVWSRPVSDNPTVPDRPGTTAAVVNGSVWDKYAVLRSRRD